MGVVPIDPARTAAKTKAEPLTFWQRIAQLLDRCMVNRSYRGIPTTALRRSKYDLNRCRRMLHGAGSPAVIAIDDARSRRGVRAVQTRT
jgi:hypothetical protein